MHAFSYVWSLRSRDKDGGHTIQSGIAENPMLHANFMAVTFHRNGVVADGRFTLRIGILFLLL